MRGSIKWKMEKKNIAIASGILVSLVAILIASGSFTGDSQEEIILKKISYLEHSLPLDPQQVYGIDSEKNGDDEIVIIIEFEEKSGVEFQKEKEMKKTTISKEDHKQLIISEQETVSDTISRELGYNIKVKDKWSHVLNGESATIKRKDLEKIKALPGVKNVWEETIEYPDLQDAVPLIEADETWNLQNGTGSNITGEGVIVAIIDTGVNYSHESFGGDCDSAGFLAGTCDRFVGGWDFYNEDSDPMDTIGHGTHVAGIVGGNSSSLKGVAPGVKFLVYKVCNVICNSTDMITAFENASLSGADVITMSITSGATLVTPIENAISGGSVVTISGGNAGPLYQSVNTGATADGVMAIGASTKDDQIASSSSRGPTKLGYLETMDEMKPDLVAPGNKINSSWLEGGYEAHSGTSMAAPMVAGVSALVRQMHPSWTVKELKSALLTTTDDLDILEAEIVGAGRVNALNAVNSSLTFNDTKFFFGIDEEDNETQWESIKVFNITNREDSTVSYTFTNNLSLDGLTITFSNDTVELDAGESFDQTVNLTVNNTKAVDWTDEIINGFIRINSSTGKINRIPFSFYVFVPWLDDGCPADDTEFGGPTGDITLASGLKCKYIDSGSAGVLISDAGTEDVTTLDCNGSQIIGPYFVGGRGISLSGTYNTTITNCNVTGFAYAVYLANSDYSVLKDSYLKGWIYNIDLVDLTIFNNTFQAERNPGLYDWSGWYAIQIGATALSTNITNNVFRDYDLGVYSQGIGTIVHNNSFYNLTNGVSFGSTHDDAIGTEISNNIFVDSEECAGYQGAAITLGYYAANVTSRDDSVEGFDYGVFVLDSWNNSVYNFVYENKSGVSRSFYSYGASAYETYGINSTIHNITVVDTYAYGTNKLVFSNYLRVHVTDDGSNVEGANITIYENSTGSWEIEGENETDSDGLTDWIETMFFYTYGTQNENVTASLLVQVETENHDTVNYSIEDLSISRTEEISYSTPKTFALNENLNLNGNGRFILNG